VRSCGSTGLEGLPRQKHGGDGEARAVNVPKDLRRPKHLGLLSPSKILRETQFLCRRHHIYKFKPVESVSFAKSVYERVLEIDSAMPRWKIKLDIAKKRNRIYEKNSQFTCLHGAGYMHVIRSVCG
jgi:hypothetical protein